jgi:hypothetical protein
MNQWNLQQKSLVILIFFMTLGNGYTTVLGAKEIFPSGAGVLMGFSAQLILFLLLTNLVLKDVPLRKWSIVLILISFSVYTSFFSYYKYLAQENDIGIGRDISLQAHQTLYSNVYTPIKNSLETAKSKKIDFDKQAEKEALGKGATRQAGIGSEARAYAQKSVDSEAEIAKLQPIVDNIKALFEYDTNKLDPDEILNKDRKALAAVPFGMLPPEYQIANPQSKISRDSYIEKDSNVKFYFPIKRIQQGDEISKLSLLIASAVDGLMILLSTAVDSKKGKPFKALTYFASDYISGYKDATVTLQDELNRDGVAYDTTLIGTNSLQPGIEYVSIKLQGKATEFLEFLIESIDEYTLSVDIQKLKKHSKPTFQAGFKILVNALKSPQRRWIEVKGREFYLSERHSEAFYTWISEEMVIQARHEAALSNKTTFSKSSQTVRMRIPIFS